MDKDLKHRRERFISGHHGSDSPLEVFQLIMIAQLSHILYESFVFAFPTLKIPKREHKNSQWTIANLFRFLVDYILVYSPFILSITIFHQQISLILGTILTVIFMNFSIYLHRNFSPIGKKILLWKNFRQIVIDYSLPNENSKTQKQKLPYISNMMSSLLFATCLAIFAVDFRVFDRRFAKTEMYGWSLMDVGVGGFIAMNGGLSPESRMKNMAMQDRLIKTIRSTWPLLTLGFMRLIAVKSVNYQEHVSEYGVHWNFFFTISFVKIFSSILCSFLGSAINLTVMSISMMIIHQILLKSYLTDYILDDDNRFRTILSANKEGLISLIGFVSIYLFFVQLGQIYIPKRNTIGEFLLSTLQIFMIGLQSLVIMLASHNLVEPVSRRECNLAFICFIFTCSSLNITIELLYFIWLQTIRAHVTEQPQSQSFSVINRNGLLLFLVANLVTGAINLLIDTLQISDLMAVLLIHIYGAFLTGSGIILDKILFNIK